MGRFGFAREDEFDGLIRQESDAAGVPFALVKAVIAQESGFDPTAYRAEPAVGDASRGLMQTLYRTAKGEGFTGQAEQLFDPATSIRFGARYLARQYRRYWSNPGDAYAAYNAGSAYQDSEGYYTNSKGDRAVNARVQNVLTYYAGYSEAETPSGGASSPDWSGSGDPGTGADVSLFAAASEAASGVAEWVGSLFTPGGASGIVEPGGAGEASGGILGFSWGTLALAALGVAVAWTVVEELS